MVGAGLTAASMALAGCATTGQELRIGGYYWVPNPNAPTCTSINWKQVAADRIKGLCYVGNDKKNNYAVVAKAHTSCAIPGEGGQCTIFSPYSEVDAMSIKMSPDDNDTLWKHERRHLLDKLKHPED
jgi:hypothetical protein